MYNGEDFTANTFVAYAQACVSSGQYVEQALIARTAGFGTIQQPITNFSRPELSDVTFNTKSFAQRAALIYDSNIEYYMMFKPKAPCCAKRIDRLVFRLPRAFGYPPTKVLDACQFMDT